MLSHSARKVTPGTSKASAEEKQTGTQGNQKAGPENSRRARRRVRELAPGHKPLNRKLQHKGAPRAMDGKG